MSQETYTQKVIKFLYDLFTNSFSSIENKYNDQQIVCWGTRLLFIIIIFLNLHFRLNGSNVTCLIQALGRLNFLLKSSPCKILGDLLVKNKM